MADWFKERLKEKSTYVGLSLLGACTGVVIDVATLELAISSLFGFWGAVETVRSENG